jgi:Tfp pilus assembly protein PilF
LPTIDQRRRELHDYMALCFDAGALGLLRLGDSPRAKEVCDAALEFAPKSPGPWTVRGIVTYPDQHAVSDFRKAASLGDASYFAYYYLAHEALLKNDFPAASDWCEKALERKPSRLVNAQVLGWLAACRDYLGGSPAEVEVLFKKALEIDPENQEVRSNYRAFQESLASGSSHSPLPASAWQHNVMQRSEEQFVSNRIEPFLRANGTSSRRLPELLAS